MARYKIVFKFLRSFVFKYKTNIFSASFFLFIVTILSAFFPYLFKLLIDTASNKNINLLKSYGIYFSILAIVLLVAMFISNYIFEKLNQKVMRDIRIQLLKKIHTSTFELIKKSPAGFFIQRIIDDVNNVKPLICANYFDYIFNIFKSLIIFYIIITLSTKLTLILILIIPLYLIIYKLYTKKIIPLVQERQKAFALINAEIEQGINNSYIIRIYGVLSNFIKDFSEKYNLYLKKFLSVFLFNFWFSNIYGNLLMLGGQIALIWIGGVMIINNQITPGTLIAFILYSSTIFEIMQFFLNFNVVIEPSLISLNRIYEILNWKDTYIPEYDISSKISLSDQTAIKIRNLNFSYKNSNEQLFDNFCLDIKKSSWNAIISRSGTGKTTLINIILKLIKIPDGKIFIFGTDLNKIPIGNLIKYIGVLEQEPMIFKKTIKENIRLFIDNNIEIENIKHKINDLNLLNINSIDVKTFLRKSATDLSGGEKKRLSILRLLLRNSEILLLDEPSSYLDDDNSLKIIEVIKKSFNEKTVIIFTHSKLLMDLCDQIIYLK